MCEEIPRILAMAPSYTEEEVMQFIKDFEVEWVKDNSIATLAFTPKKRGITPYMLFAYQERKRMPNGGKG
jgi:hypothetical protein